MHDDIENETNKAIIKIYGVNLRLVICQSAIKPINNNIANIVHIV